MANVATLTYPAPLVVGYGPIEVALFLPIYGSMVSATGHDNTGGNSLTYSLTAPSLSAFTGASAPALAVSASTLVASGTAYGSGSSTASAPMGTLVASGTTSPIAVANLTFGTNLSTYSLVGFSGAVLGVISPNGNWMAAGGTVGGYATGVTVMPLFNLVASGTVKGTLSTANLLMPMGKMVPSGVAWVISPMGQLVAAGSAVVSVTYEGYATNLNHTSAPGVTPVDEITHYTNYPFDRIVRYKNSYFGMNNTGLYLLDGTTDNGTPTAWAVQTTETDFGVANLKTVEQAYFGGRLPPATTVSLLAGEGASTPYAYTTPRGALAQNYRQPFGRGIKSRFFSIGLAGTGAMTLDNVDLTVTTLARKI